MKTREYCRKAQCLQAISGSIPGILGNALLTIILIRQGPISTVLAQAGSCDRKGRTLHLNCSATHIPDYLSQHGEMFTHGA